MTDSRVALGMDRLPWLPDEPVRTPRRSAKPLAWAAAAAMCAIAGASYWIGNLSGRGELETPTVADDGRPVATAPLPLPSQPDVARQESPKVAAPEVERIVAPPIPVIDEPPARRTPIERPAAAPESTPAVEGDETATPTVEAEPAEPPASAPAPARPAFTGPWPVRVVEGASGRLVRIGAFRTSRQAKKGWWAIVKMNPTLKRLPALVVPVQSMRNGHTYYRLQMGTTSQAHSTVLCQRMRMIGQSCVVIDERARGAR
ncbi:MAG TPA: hypothetical protein VJM15_00370 [Sphingomicrobium sp.]|nr:hypothetical protein [Sphingomicrobium sp.]